MEKLKEINSSNIHQVLDDLLKRRDEKNAISRKEPFFKLYVNEASMKLIKENPEILINCFKGLAVEIAKELL